MQYEVQEGHPESRPEAEDGAIGAQVLGDLSTIQKVQLGVGQAEEQTDRIEEERLLDLLPHLLQHPACQWQGGWGRLRKDIIR